MKYYYLCILFFYWCALLGSGIESSIIDSLSESDKMYIAYEPFIQPRDEQRIFEIIKGRLNDANILEDVSLVELESRIRLKVLDNIAQVKIKQNNEVLAQISTTKPIIGVFTLPQFINELRPLLPSTMKFVYLDDFVMAGKTGAVKFDIPIGVNLWELINGDLLEYYYVSANMTPMGEILLGFSAGNFFPREIPESLKKEHTIHEPLQPQP